MMKAPTYLVAVILLLLFSAKTVIPVFERIKSEEKATVEKQEEKSNEKSENIEAEKTEIIIFHSSYIAIRRSYFERVHTFQAMQYFAIPTPPPWC